MTSSPSSGRARIAQEMIACAGASPRPGRDPRSRRCACGFFAIASRSWPGSRALAGSGPAGVQCAPCRPRAMFGRVSQSGSRRSRGDHRPSVRSRHERRRAASSAVADPQADIRSASRCGIVQSVASRFRSRRGEQSAPFGPRSARRLRLSLESGCGDDLLTVSTLERTGPPSSEILLVLAGPALADPIARNRLIELGFCGVDAKPLRGRRTRSGSGMWPTDARSCGLAVAPEKKPLSPPADAGVRGPRAGIGRPDVCVDSRSVTSTAD